MSNAVLILPGQPSEVNRSGSTPAGRVGVSAPVDLAVPPPGGSFAGGVEPAPLPVGLRMDLKAVARSFSDHKVFRPSASCVIEQRVPPSAKLPDGQPVLDPSHQGILLSNSRGDGVGPRVSRLENFKRRAREIASHGRSRGSAGEVWRVNRLDKCGTWVQLREFLKTGRARLAKSNFCGQDRLCPFCAASQMVRRVRKAVERLLVVGQGRIYAHLVFGLRDGPDLRERFEVLASAWGRMMERRRNARKGIRVTSEMEKTAGGVSQYEVHRGSGSGEWHPHVHALGVLDDYLDWGKLCKEWCAIVGDPAAHCRIHEVGRGEDDIERVLFEVLAYQLKFSRMTPADVWEAWELLRGRRLMRTWGVMRGTPEPGVGPEPGEELAGDLCRILEYAWNQDAYQVQYTGDWEPFRGYQASASLAYSRRRREVGEGAAAGVRGDT